MEHYIGLTDDRLTEIERIIRQRHWAEAKSLIDQVERDVQSPAMENADELQGQLLLLRSELATGEADYRKAIETGLKSAALLAHTTHTRLYGRSLLGLSNAYFSIGDFRNSDIRSRDALAAFRQSGDIEGQIEAYNHQARTSFTRNDFRSAATLIDEALSLCDDIPRKKAQLQGNAGRVKILTGQWEEAEKDLKAAYDYARTNGESRSEAVNLLSIGFLAIRQRNFTLADKTLKQARTLIERQNLTRERIIFLEYWGELAFERGDLVKAKGIFSDAYQQARLIAPESALVSQSARRLAETEFALENHQEAMRSAQKGLEIANQIGERIEAAHCRRLIGQIFAATKEFDEAEEYLSSSIQLLQHCGDPYDLARSTVIIADTLQLFPKLDSERIRTAYRDSYRTFRQLHVDYWIAETDFRSGSFACRQGNLTRGLFKISRAEKLFSALSENTRIRSVQQFVSSVAGDAVASALSRANGFKVLSDVLSSNGTKETVGFQIDTALQLVQQRSSAFRAIAYIPELQKEMLVSSHPLSKEQSRGFLETFARLAGQEVSVSRPTLILDCRRDPYINNLFPGSPHTISSVLVIPFKISDRVVNYLYLDRITADGGMNCFGQEELNFAVGFSDVLAFTVAQAQTGRLLEDNRRLKAQLKQETSFENIITRNDTMIELLNQLRLVVDSGLPILISGETGSGKDLLARAVHYNSNRRDKQFISVNCSALPEALLESELFGYRKGAFVGADRDRAGLIEEADGGTFFLDEVAEMPPSIQAKLLRVIESRELVRLGETQPRRIDVRMIAATNRHIESGPDSDRFRQDLFYRLSALPFSLPPLRERKEDIPALIDHFLRGTGKRLSPDAQQRCVAYDWPGNIRELENEIRKLTLLAGPQEMIQASMLSPKLRNAVASSSSTPAPVAANAPFTEEFSLYDFLSKYEREYIVQALREAHGVKKHAAARLFIPESTLRLKIREYGLDPSNPESLH